MTLLVISPDYASHLYPLATLATAWRDRGERVVIATGTATDALVTAFGYEREHLQLGRGSNPGVIRAEEQPAGEDDSLRGFFEATRLGAVETLAYQARARSVDLLWNAVGVARAVQDVVARTRPDTIIVDHLAFGARLGLASSGTSHADVVLGHPSALTVGDEVYGYPPAWPRAFAPEPKALAELRGLSEHVRDDFTAQWNAALAQLSPGAPPSRDAFAETGDVLLLNYPAELHDPHRTSLLPRHTFLGSAARTEAPDEQVEDWLARSEEPLIYVSLGSFLSARSDVLRTIADALRRAELGAVIASGVTPPADLGALPQGCVVRPYLPQIAALRSCDVAICHGGNNTAMEALTAGLPVVALPFSTDQFAVAADLVDAGLGAAVEPNRASADDLVAAVRVALSPATTRRAAAVGRALRSVPGHERAARLLLRTAARRRSQRGPAPA